MTGFVRECRQVRDALARRDALSAVERAFIDVHLRRCDACRAAAQGLAQLEQRPRFDVALDDAARNRIFDALSPSVVEVAQRHREASARRPMRPLSAALAAWKRRSFALGALGAAAALVAVLALEWSGTKSQPRAVSPVAGDFARESEGHMTRVLRLPGYLDRLHGAFRVDGAPIGHDKGEFAVAAGSRLETAAGSTVTFRIGEGIRAAMSDRSDVQVVALTDTLARLYMRLGRLAVEYDGTQDRVLEVHTPTAVVRVRGTIFTVEVFDGGATQVSVARGRVDVVSEDDAGVPHTVALGQGQLLEVPGEGIPAPMGQAQRALAEEVAGEGVGANQGRLVHFSGGQQHVEVEIDGQVVGYTPLTVRLPEGPVHYRLTKPGMKPVEGVLRPDDGTEEVRATLTPSLTYVPKVAASRKAARRARTLVQREPRSTEEANLLRAKAALAAGDLPFAVHVLEENVKTVRGERRVEALALLAESYTALGMFAQAADTFDAVVRAARSGSAVAQNARFEVGRIAMRNLGDYDRARNAFTAYVAAPGRSPLEEDAYFSLCVLDVTEGKRAKALQCFTEFLAIFPEGHKNSFAHLWRGVLYQEVRRDWKAAEADLRAFIAANPRHPRCDEARYRIALGRYNRNDRAGALRMISEYLSVHPNGRYKVRVERLQADIEGNDLR